MEDELRAMAGTPLSLFLLSIYRHTASVSSATYIPCRSIHTHGHATRTQQQQHSRGSHRAAACPRCRRDGCLELSIRGGHCIRGGEVPEHAAFVDGHRPDAAAAGAVTGHSVHNALLDEGPALLLGHVGLQGEGEGGTHGCQVHVHRGVRVS
jgi:hypothetical protein